MARRLRSCVLALALGSLASCSSKSAPYTPNCTEVPGVAQDDLQCTGLYATWSTKALSPDAIPYTPGLILWSDGADKSRWLYLPPGAQIDTTDMDHWKFPVGTKVWKEFRLGGKRIETRYFYKQSAQWVWTTYRWSDDESRAPRLPTGEQNVGGGTYEIPDQIGCDKCHRGSVDKLLGVEAIALGQPTAQGVTLASLAQSGRLTAPPAQTTIAIPEDSTGKAAAAIGYMHMNCGVSCHVNISYVEGSESGLFTRLSATQLLAGKVTVSDLDVWKTAYKVPVTHQQHYEYAQQGFDLITPGNSAKSLVPALAALRDNGKEQMPPLGTHLEDTTGVALIDAWIDALPAN